MGLFTWFSSTAKKSVIAVEIQRYFEIVQKHGLFDADPAKVANQLVNDACDKIPGFVTAGYSRYVTAAGVMAIAVMNYDVPRQVRSLHSMALAGMMKAALEFEPPNGYSHAELKILHGAKIALMNFDSEASPFKWGEPINETPSPQEATAITSVPTPVEVTTFFVSDDPISLENAMKEHVRKLNASALHIT